MMPKHAFHCWRSTFFAIRNFSLFTFRVLVSVPFVLAVLPLCFLSNLFNSVLDVVSSPNFIIPSRLEQVAISGGRQQSW